MRILVALLMFVASSLAFAGVVAIPGASGQRAMVGQPFTNAIGVRVTDELGRPVPAAEVRFVSLSIQGGGLELSEGFYRYTTQAGIDGIAVLAPGARADSGERHLISVFAQLPTGPSSVVTLEFFTDGAMPMRLTAVSPTEQIVEAGHTLPQGARMRLTRADGTPLAGGLVSFLTDPNEVVGSFGALSTAAVQTDADGYADAPPFTTSLEVGRGVLVARYLGSVGSFVEARFFFTNVAGPAGPRKYQDMWWGGPTQNGWGVSVIEHGERSFAVVFAYDANGKQTWHVMPFSAWAGGYGRILQSVSYQPHGTPFYAYDASRLVVENGPALVNLSFIGGDQGVLHMDGAHFGGGLERTGPGQPIFRQNFTTDPAAPLRGVADMWWGGPSQNGWGIAVHEQPGQLFSVWLTYDGDGNPAWFVMPGGTWTSANTFVGRLYRTSSSAFRETPYDASKLQVMDVGDYRFRFNGDTATFDYSVDGRTGTLALSRQPF